MSEALDLGAIDAPAGGPDDAEVDVDQPSAFTPAMLGPYFRGNQMAAIAIQKSDRLTCHRRRISLTSIMPKTTASIITAANTALGR